MEILVTIGYIILCVLLFSLSIAIHEFGHFIAALKLGYRVERFSIGFGPAIWKKTYKGIYIDDDFNHKAIRETGGAGRKGSGKRTP